LISYDRRLTDISLHPVSRLISFGVLLSGFLLKTAGVDLFCLMM